MHERSHYARDIGTRTKGSVVAIVGADGSGKSTIARMLTTTSPGAMKYIYMGSSIEASNVALPTSRLLIFLKRRRLKPFITQSDRLPPANIMSDEMRSRLPRGRLIKALAFFNRIAEEWYRQLYALVYVLRGYIVICDRHFLYEYCPDSESILFKEKQLSVRLHDLFLSRFYPKPDLTIFLDAPTKVLHLRKPEWNLEHLEHQRRTIIQQGRASDNFVQVDATQSINNVISDVRDHIEANRILNRSVHFHSNS